MGHSNRHDIAIRGVLTLTAVAHQTSPDRPATDAPTPQMKASVVSNGVLVRAVPIITANSVKGLIRRAAGELLMDQLSHDGKQISRNLYLSIMRGSFARTGIQAGGANYMQLVAAKNDPFVGLFGGGAYMYDSSVRMERDLYPMLECIKNNFPIAYQAQCIDLQPYQIMGTSLIASRDDFQKLAAPDLIEDAEASYAEHMGVKLAANAAKREQKANTQGEYLADSDKLTTTDLNMFNQLEVIAAGTPLYFGMTAKNVTEAQIGLLLQAVCNWSNNNALGGGSSRGRGSFVPSLQLFQDGEKVTDHLLIDASGTYNLSTTVKPFVDVMREALKTTATPEHLNTLYPTELTAKSGKKTKTTTQNMHAGLAT